MRILITGGFGFVGGRLAAHLTKKGLSVVLGSRSAAAYPTWLPQVEVLQIDWADTRALELCCKGVDVVVHAAGMNAQDCAADPVAALAFNGVATSRLVAAACRADVQRFIYLSTAHVYASPLVGTITEDTCPRNLHPYATSHLAGETAVLRASQLGLIQGIVLRLSNAFGAPMHKDADCWRLLVNDLCRQLVTTQEMVLHSTGLQRRDFVPLADVCGAIGHLLELPAHNLGSGLFNVGGAWAPTVWEIAGVIGERCEAILGFLPQRITTVPLTKETAPSLDYHMDALLQTGYQPSADRIEEIDRTIKFCKTSLDWKMP